MLGAASCFVVRVSTSLKLTLQELGVPGRTHFLQVLDERRLEAMDVRKGVDHRVGELLVGEWQPILLLRGGSKRTQESSHHWQCHI